MSSRRSSSFATNRWSLRTVLGGGLLAAVAGCTAILGFDKDVFEQGRDPAGEQDGSAPDPSSDGGGRSDATTPETENRGVLDPTFGDAGTTEISATLYWSVTNPTSVTDACRAVLDGSGRIVVACATDAQQPAAGEPPLETRVFCLSGEGALDTGYGSSDGGGLRILDFVPEIAARPNGGVLLAGYASPPSVVRYAMGKSLTRAFDNDGEPDPSFADAGALAVVLTDDPDNDKITSIAAHGDKLVMAAWVAIRPVDNVPGYYGSAWLELDRNTGALTRVVNPKHPALEGDYATGALRPNADRTVLVGSARVTGYNPGWVSLTAYAGDTLDTSFGDGGRTVVPVHPRDIPLVTVGLLGANPDRYLVTGTTLYTDGGALVQVSPSGRMDEAFGDGGAKPFPTAPFDPPPRLEILTALLASDGKIVAGGALVLGNGTRRPVVFRMLPTGDIDPSFGKGGWITPTFGEQTTEGKVEQVLFTPNGRILAIGTALLESGTRNVFVQRFR